ncbi:hypothetical protein X801_01605 [Opisthorchis viverrini]|uniref:Uncharacterized protein n=2 Tax=Opisthorchis viverrini TaxID=6198 RepID=A0A1S8X7T2_OPIVI|nr:hypothetical protein T265_10994 [Opisthorchis viverrini]KER20461.1 hypothetical protein T265_10994 [Opisthorchis viverrini]OON22493.1 hypothetical protein X801_01605 [Opisthorchis viverrini]
MQEPAGLLLRVTGIKKVETLKTGEKNMKLRARVGPLQHLHGTEQESVLEHVFSCVSLPRLAQYWRWFLKLRDYYNQYSRTKLISTQIPFL